MIDNENAVFTRVSAKIHKLFSYSLNREITKTAFLLGWEKNKKPLHSEHTKIDIRSILLDNYFVCSLCNGFRQVRALFKIIFSCMNNMFLANTKVGKFCHLCLEHDYTTAFSECQVLSKKIFKCAFHKHFLFEPTASSTKAVLKSDCPNRFREFE